jgi:hypothetical protein
MSTKFAPGGFAPANLPPVCKAPPLPYIPPPPGFSALIVTLAIQWDCVCHVNDVNHIKGSILQQLTYNPGADQYVGSGTGPGGMLWNAIYDHAPTGYPTDLCLKLLLPCGDEYVGCQTKVNGGPGKDRITFQFYTKHCDVSGGTGS